MSYGAHALEFQDVRTGGTSRQRAADIMEAFADPDVDAIVAADAGIGTRDLLEFLDMAEIQAHPKSFVGYCDNVFLSHYLAVRAGIGSIYGCTYMQHFGEAGGPFPETVEEFEQVLAGSGPLARRPYESRTREWFGWFSPTLDTRLRTRSDKEPWTVLREGSGTGPLLGAELGLFGALIDDFGFDPTGAVLFWDVHPSNIAPLPDQLRRLAARCDLTRLAGMVVGVDLTVGPEPWAEAVRAALAPHVANLSYPIVANADLGHLQPSWIVPYGATVTLDTGTGLIFPVR